MSTTRTATHKLKLLSELKECTDSQGTIQAVSAPEAAHACFHGKAQK